MGNNMNKHLQNAEKTGVLQLQGAGLDEFPSTLKEKQEFHDRLRSLDLSSNKIVKVPTWIGTFVFLKSLNLSDNRIQVLPDELCSLKKLEVLEVNRNRLEALPRDFAKLSNLRVFSACFNQFRVFPVELTALANIDSIALSGNGISQIPPEIQHCKAIELNLNQNQLNGLVAELCSCERLKVLRVEENCLELRVLEQSGVLKGSRVASLFVDGNLFDAKQLRNADGYEQYEQRYTAEKKKLV